MLDWLHDSYFAAVAGDGVTFEAWPSDQGVFRFLFSVFSFLRLPLWGMDTWELMTFIGHADYYLHEHLLAFWGCPIGEMLDLEELSRMCWERKRWTFFVNSVPARCHGEFVSWWW